MPPAIIAFDHVHLSVGDREASERWYEQVLGLVRAKEFEFWSADGGPLILQSADGCVRVSLFQRPPRKGASTVSLLVGAADFLQWRSHL